MGLGCFVAVSSGSTSAPTAVRDARYASEANAASNQYGIGVTATIGVTAGVGTKQRGANQPVGSKTGNGSTTGSGSGSGGSASGVNGSTNAAPACSETVTILPTGVINTLGGDCGAGIPVHANGKWTFTTICALSVPCSAGADVTTKLPVLVKGVRQLADVQIDPTTYRIKPGKSKLVHMRFDKRGRRLLASLLTVRGSLHVHSYRAHHVNKTGSAKLKFHLVP